MRYFAGSTSPSTRPRCAWVDEVGTIIREGKAGSEPAALISCAGDLGMPLDRIGLEPAPALALAVRRLREDGYPAVCIETRRVEGATAAMAVKTDRNDARAIAQAIRVGWYTAVHVKTALSQSCACCSPTARRSWRPNSRSTTRSAASSRPSAQDWTGHTRDLPRSGRRPLGGPPRLMAMVVPMLKARETCGARSMSCTACCCAHQGAYGLPNG